MQLGKTFYTVNSSLYNLRKKICNYTERRIGLTYNSDNEVLVTVGGSEAIDIALRTIINPGDEILYIEPSFVSYMPCIVVVGGIPVPIECNGYHVECGRFLAEPYCKDNACKLRVYHYVQSGFYRPPEACRTAQYLRLADELYPNQQAEHGLIKVGSSLVPFANKFPKNTKLYKLMTTKLGESA